MNSHEISSLKDEMLENAQLILKSVSFYEREIIKTMSLIDEAENNKLYDDLPELKEGLLILIHKIGKQNNIMDAFLVKYRKLVQKEKASFKV